MRNQLLMIGILLVILALAFSGCSRNNVVTTVTPISSVTCVEGSPTTGKYLKLRDGTEGRILLVDSNLRYGAFEEEVWFPWTDSKAVTGDKAVIITGTIRNDYEEDYYVTLTADIYNTKGEKVGTILCPGAPMPGFAVAFVKKASLSPFEIWIKYDQQDVERYCIFMAHGPSTGPPP